IRWTSRCSATNPAYPASLLPQHARPAPAAHHLGQRHLPVEREDLVNPVLCVHRNPHVPRHTPSKLPASLFQRRIAAVRKIVGRGSHLHLVVRKYLSGTP